MLIVSTSVPAAAFSSYVPIASGFGPRFAPCGSCSFFHDGIDL